MNKKVVAFAVEEVAMFSRSGQIQGVWLRRRRRPARAQHHPCLWLLTAIALLRSQRRKLCPAIHVSTMAWLSILPQQYAVVELWLIRIFVRMPMAVAPLPLVVVLLRPPSSSFLPCSSSARGF